MIEHRRITGRRSDLSGVRAPGSLRRLFVDGPGIASLRGIEMMTGLVELTLERLASPELERLSGLTALRKLTVDRLTGEVDYRPLSRLRGLRYLYIAADGEAAARAVAKIDFAALAELRDLVLTTEPGPLTLNVGWLDALPQLEAVTLDGFVFDDRVVEALDRDAVRLEQLSFTPASERQEVLLRQRLPHIRRLHARDGGVAPLERILHDPKSRRGERFSVGIDLADGRRGNPEAELDLRERLAAEDPDLLGRLRFDTESSAVWVLSDRRTDLERVLGLVKPPRR